MTDETPAPGSGGTSAGSAPPQKPVTTVTAGTLIMGTYEIEKLINSGGMGEVYRGRNIHNGEPVAIKIVLPALAHDPKIVALFQKESTVLSRLAHEAIVRYHVFTNDPTIGRPCMVMEFVSGTPLADRIEQGPMPVDEVRTMLRRVASGLDKAHRAGVVHRDLSPDNVILEEGMVEHAKLIDFGIAKSANFGSGTLLQGQFAGKFNWVSPEQLGAFGGQVDGRSDIYSLALIVAGASRGQVLQMGASIVDAVSKRASVPDLTGVDPELVPLLTWMLEPDPAKRVESMAKVMAALDNPALIPGPPAPPPPDPNRTVIEPLPQLTVPPAPAPAPAAATTAPPVAAPTGGDWDMPAPRQISQVAPDGATVIAPQPLVSVPPPVVSEVEEDVSPFGAPARAVPDPGPSRPAVEAPAQKGKGGMIGTLAVLAIAAGGAGAWFGGVFDSKDPAAKPAQPEVVAQADPAKAPEGTAEPGAKPADETGTAQEDAAAKAAADAEAAKAAQEEAAATAAAAQKAAEEAAAKAAADAEAAKQAEAEAAAKAEADAEASRKAADEAAAKAAEQALAAAKAAADEARSHMESISAAASMAEVARAEAADAAAAVAKADPAQGPAPVQALADSANAAARKARTAADAATQGLEAAKTAAAAAAAVEDAAKGLADLLAKAETEVKAAADSAAKAEAEATAAAAAAKTAADAEAARLAEAQQREAAIKADPVARQQAFLTDYVPPACVHVSLAEAKAEGFALHGYAVDTKPLEELSAAWVATTESKPDVAVHLVNEEQCPALDFMNNQRAGATVAIRLNGGAEVVKSGTPVEGVIEGAQGRPLTLFLVNGKGGATNLKDFVTTAADGSVSFKFRVKLADGLPPEPQVLVVLASDAATNGLLDKVKPGTSTGGLFPFVENRMKDAGVTPAVGLGFFRLEN